MKNEYLKYDRKVIEQINVSISDVTMYTVAFSMLSGKLEACKAQNYSV